jgi:hypothetical protein
MLAPRAARETVERWSTESTESTDGARLTLSLANRCETSGLDPPGASNSAWSSERDCCRLDIVSEGRAGERE